MNRKLLSVIFACGCVFAVGCQSQEVKQAENMQPPQKQTEESVENKDLTEQEASDSLQGNAPTKEDPPSVTQEENVISYQLKKEIYQNGDRTIHYPQLMQMEDRNKEQQINELLKKEVLKYVSQLEDIDATLNLDYQVMMNTQNTLSILYTGDYSVSGGIYPTHHLFTTNVNIKDGGKIRLSDVVTINETFVEKFKQSPYMDREQPSSPNNEKSTAVKEYLNSINQQELIDAFKQADNPSIEDNPFGIYTYFAEDVLIISIQVPHALGDHAEFQFDLE
jgi:hypothetical protein